MRVRCLLLPRNGQEQYFASRLRRQPRSILPGERGGGMNHFQAAIFDLDGTLLDSMGVWEKIDVEFLAKRGFTVPPDYLDAICARTFYEVARYTIARFALSETPEDLMEEWRQMALCEYSCKIRLKPYVKEYLSLLHTRGIKLGTATTLSPQLSGPCLENNGIAHFFDAQATTDQAGSGKDKPDVYLLAARQLGFPPEACIVFEDLPQGILSAKQAGMTAIGVLEYTLKDQQTRMRGIADGFICDFREAPIPPAIGSR